MWVRKIGSRYRAAYRDGAGREHSKRFDRLGDAQSWAREQERRVRLSRHYDPRAGQQTVASYCELAWWPNRSTERTTAATDRGRLDNHVLKHWGDWPIASISPSAVQAWVTSLVAKHGLAPATARSCHNLLRSILQDARRDGLIADNPATGVRLPKPAANREVYLSRDEIAAVCAELTADDAAIVIVLAYTGLRWGELAGLRANRLRMLERRLDVVETMTEIAGRREPKPWPKGRKRRTVPIASAALDALANYLGRHPARGAQLVFRDRRGEPLSRQWGRRHFRPAVEAALGRSDVRVHDLRHTCASWLVQAGVPLYEVGRILGHESTATTARYAHFAPDGFDRVLGALDERPAERRSSFDL